jgi:hypothetical protein
MADQGEGGVDASDDYDARISSLNKKNQKLAEEAAQMEQRVLEMRKAKAAKALAEAEAAANRFTLVGDPYVTGSKTTVSTYMAGNPTYNEVGRPIQQTPSGGGEIPKHDPYANAKDAEWNRDTKKAEFDLSGLSIAASAASAASAATAAFYTVARAMENMANSQASGASSVMATQNTLGDSFQNLGINGEDKMLMSDSGKRFKGKGDQKSYAKFYKAVADSHVRSGSMAPVDQKGIEALYSQFDEGSLNEDQLMRAANNPLSAMAPDVARGFATGFKPTNQTQTAYENQKFTADIERNKYSSENSRLNNGKKTLREQQWLENQGRESVWGALYEPFGRMFSSVHDDTTPLNKTVKVQVVNKGPPSTTDGK